MDATLASLIGTTIGALSGIVGGFFASRYQSKIEKEKWVREQKEQTNKNVRIAVNEFAKKIAEGIHVICWLCWRARYAPDVFNSEHIDEYEKEMKMVFPALVSSRINLASLDKEYHEKLTMIIDEFYKLESELGQVYSKYQVESNKSLIIEIGEFWDRAINLDKKLVTDTAKIISSQYSALIDN